MSNKPVVVCVGFRSTFGENEPEKDALLVFLKHYCGCEIVSYFSNYDFENNLEHLKKNARERIVFIIYIQEEYSSSSYFDSFYRLVRSNFDGLPLAVIGNRNPKKKFVVKKRFHSVYSFVKTDKELIDLARRLISQFKVSSNWLGAETPADQALVARQLEQVYRFHSVSEKNVDLGTPDHNHMTVAEALRIHLTPPECLRSEFDDVLEHSPREFPSVDSSVYQQETFRIKTMTDSERSEFALNVLLAQGYEPAGNGGVYRTRSFFGDKINGFAIDSVTLEVITTYRFSEHALAYEELAKRVIAIERLGLGKDSEDLDSEKVIECYRRIFKGLILYEVKGFQTPIIEIRPPMRPVMEQNSEPLGRIARFLKKQGKFIPINYKCYLLEG